MSDPLSSAAFDHVSRQLAVRVLEEWCLKGDEPMEGEGWNTYCALLGVDPVSFARNAQAIRETMTPAERQKRSKELYRERNTAAIIEGLRRD